MKRALSIAMTTAHRSCSWSRGARQGTDQREKKLNEVEVRPRPEAVTASTRRRSCAFGERDGRGKKISRSSPPPQGQVTIDVRTEGKELAEETAIAPAPPRPIKAAAGLEVQGWRHRRAETVDPRRKAGHPGVRGGGADEKEKFEVVSTGGEITRRGEEPANH
jgi:hypothetical protein